MNLSQMRPVYVAGVGWHRYQPQSETSFVDLGLVPTRAALADAGMDWSAVDTSYLGHAKLPMAAGRTILRHLGAHGKPLVHIENASASGSAAFRHACIEVACGMADVALALGVDKPYPTLLAEAETGIETLAEDAIVPFTHFALLANQYMSRNKAKEDDIARVAVKNHRNASKNRNAHRQAERSLAEVLGGRRIAGAFTALQCCPVGEGGAAVILVSERAIQTYGLDASRAVRVTASCARSQRLYEDDSRYDTFLTAETSAMALMEAGVRPAQVDVVELHDAFTVEELEYVEAMGFCEEGEAVQLLRDGAFDIGGRHAINPSGGLIAMGHPIGPTGVGQIAEIVLQLRGEAGSRQHANSRIGLAHMVGLGAVCYVHILQR